MTDKPDGGSFGAGQMAALLFAVFKIAARDAHLAWRPFFEYSYAGQSARCRVLSTAGPLPFNILAKPPCFGHLLKMSRADAFGRIPIRHIGS